jgi:nucleoside-diphosphate-sugar epimerase
VNAWHSPAGLGTARVAPNNGAIVNCAECDMPSTVLILGAAGRLGRVLCSAFADAGWRVQAQARKPLPTELAAHPRIRMLGCDATDVAALRAGAEGAAVIVNALNPPYAAWDRLALPLADAALAAARATGALLMLPGNVYNFGNELPPRLAPDTPERGNTPKARIRIETEARLEAAAAEGVDSVVIRAGDFFGGRGRGTWLDMALAAKLARGRIVYPGRPDIAHAWAYLPDLAQTFVRVASQRTALSGHHRFHFEGHTLSGNDWRWALEAITGRTLQLRNLPWGFIRLASPLVPMWRELLPMRYLWQRPHALDDAGLRGLLGEVPHTPLPEALSAALADLADAGDAPGMARA